MLNSDIQMTTIVKHSHFTTSTNVILGSHSLDDQYNVFKSITKQNSLYENFNFIGKSTPKLFRFKINSFDNM